MPTVRIWSSCLEPVPPIFILLGPAALTAARYSLAVLYGVSALTHSTNWSSAIIDTGVMSRQLKGTPVASGVVNRFDSVMTILCGSPLAPLTSRKPSAPAPPDLLTTISGCFISLCLTTMPWIRRAIWSAPPPVPAGTTNSTGLVGSHAAWAGPAARAGGEHGGGRKAARRDRTAGDEARRAHDVSPGGWAARRPWRLVVRGSFSFVESGDQAGRSSARPSTIRSARARRLTAVNEAG